MKVAKNKKSAFLNLFEVVSQFDDEEKQMFQKFLTKKRKQSKSKKLFQYVLNLVDSGEIPETIDESVIKKEIEQAESRNFNKLTEHLYKRVLVFISEQFVKTEHKKWQIEAKQSLLEVEALCSRKLYSQAIAHLLKLEDRIHDKFDKRFRYDDIGIFTRMANLKVSLHSWGEELYSTLPDDKLLTKLLGLGSFFYHNEMYNQSLKLFKEKKGSAYHFLSEYLRKRKKHEETLYAIDNAINSVNAEQFDRPEIPRILLQYYRLYKAFWEINFPTNSPTYSYQKFDKENPVVYAMLQEDLLRRLRLSLSGGEDLIIDQQDSNYYIDLITYSDKKISNIAYRLEFNRAIIFFLKKEHDESKKILELLGRKKEIKDKDNPIFLDVLFLKVLLSVKLGIYDINDLLRSISTILKNIKEPKFEKNALELIKKWSNSYPDLGMRNFILENEDKLKELDELRDKTKPMHNIVYLSLADKI